MFNFFNNNKADNHISLIFNGLTLNQRMSIINLLSSIAFCDGDNGNQEKEMKYLNSYFRILNVRFDNCMKYHEINGLSRIFEDLKCMSRKQKEFLVSIVWELVICDGRPNETEIQVTMNMFEKIGISQEEFMDILNKTLTIINHYNK